MVVQAKSYVHQNWIYNTAYLMICTALFSRLAVYKSRGEEQLTLFRSFPIANVLDFSFSPKETFISILSRYGRLSVGRDGPSYPCTLHS